MAAVTVRELLVRLGVEADTAAVNQFDRALDITKKTMFVVAAAAAALTGALLGAALATARQGDEAAKAAARIGVTAEEMQELGFAAQQAGASLSDVERGFKQQARSASEAAQGVAEYADTYNRLGIQVTDANGDIKDQITLLEETADALVKLPSDIERTAAAQEIFGKAGTRLLPLLNKGADGIRRFREEARELGFVLSEEDTKASEEFKDQINAARLALVGIRNQIGVQLIPISTSLVEGFRSFIRTNGRFIRQRIDRFMERIVKVVDFVRKALIRADEVVRLRVGGWPVLFEQVNKAARLAGAIAGLTVFIKLIQAAQLALLALFAPGAPVILGIIALAAAILGLVLVGEDLLVFARGGESAIGRFLEAMDPELAIQLKDALNGLGSAIEDLQAIVEEAFAAIGIDLTTLSEFFQDTFGAAALAAIRKFSDDIGDLREGLEAIPTVFDAISTAVAKLIRTIDPVLAKLEELTGDGGVVSAIRGALLGGAEEIEIGGGAAGAAGRARRTRAAGLDSTARERQEAGRVRRQFLASNGTSAIERQTRRERQTMEALSAAVSFGDMSVTINTTGGDPEEIVQVVRDEMVAQRRQALDSITGGVSL